MTVGAQGLSLQGTIKLLGWGRSEPGWGRSCDGELWSLLSWLGLSWRRGCCELPMLGLTPGLLGFRVLLIAAPWSHLAFLLVDPMSVLRLGPKALEHPEHP